MQDKYYTALASKLMPSDQQIKKADQIYKHIISTLVNSGVVTSRSDILKQGSYKTKTLTVSKYNKNIDLDIMVSAHYDHSDKVRNAIFQSLNAAGYDCESKTRVIRVIKDGFQVDILPSIPAENNPATFKPTYYIREKQTKHQKRIAPKDLTKWILDQKRDYSTFSSDVTVKRDIDREKYNKQVANSPINLAIRILKSLAYSYNATEEYKISSFFIEICAAKMATKFGDVESNVGSILSELKEFKDNDSNFYNPKFQSEIVLRNSDYGKRAIKDFINFARLSLKRLAPESKAKTVAVAGVTISVPGLTIAASIGGGITPPHHGEYQFDRTTEGKTLDKISRLKFKRDATSNWGRVIKVTSSKGKSYTFTHKKNSLGLPALYADFQVKDKAHTYPDGSICLADNAVFMIDSIALDVLIFNWVEAYETYLICGFWGYEETKHKVFIKEEK